MIELNGKNEFKWPSYPFWEGLQAQFGIDKRRTLSNTNILFAEDTRSIASPFSELCQLQADEPKSHDVLFIWNFTALQQNPHHKLKTTLCYFNKIHVTSSKQDEL